MQPEAEATPYSTGFFDQQSAGSLSSARVVLREVFAAGSFRSAVDVGCGVATWLSVAIELGAERAVGLDGEYVDRNRLLVDADRFRACDLRSDDLPSAAGPGTFDIAICMEVAEHLPSGRAGSFVEELCRLSDLVLFSAAVPGQGGVDHVNEQWPGYWSALFDANGFGCFDVLRPRLWTRDEVEWWYLQNVMVFARRGTVAFETAGRLGPPAVAPPLAMVHPRFMPHVVRYASEAMAENLARYHPFGRARETADLEAKLDRLRVEIAEKDRLLETERALVAALGEAAGRSSEGPDGTAPGRSPARPWAGRWPFNRA